MERGHVVLLPFLAQGHLTPFLALAKLIEQRKGLAVTVVSTPLNVRMLRSSLHPESTIRLIELPFSSSDHGLSPGSENTEALPHHLFPTFFQATETLQPAFERVISSMIQEQGHSRLCIIADTFFGWTVESAKKLRVFHSVFVTSGAYATAIFLSLWLHPPLLWESFDEVPLVDFPEVRIHQSQIKNTLISGDGTDPLTVYMRRHLPQVVQSGGFLVNTAEELEQGGLGLLRRSPGLPVWPIGPLVHIPPTRACAGDSWMEFLGSKSPASVLYVSFGSHSTFPASLMMELATGLEASGKPFIWVIRPPPESDAGEEFRADQWLPEGFEARITRNKQGILVRGWALQLEILSHPSTGAFLSHCGWNSVLESLSQGVPIIGWPLLADQPYTSKMLVEEMGVAVEVARGKEYNVSKSTGWECVKGAIELVLGGSNKGLEIRKKASEIKEMMDAAVRGGGEVLGSSCTAMEDFLETALPMKH